MRDKHQHDGLAAQIHRFRNSVAVSVGTGPTTYMTAAQARQLARALYVCSRDIDKHAATDSTFGPTTIKIG